MVKERVPLGLKVLASINILIVILILHRFVLNILQHYILSSAIVIVSHIVFGIVAVLYLLSAIGYLKLMWFLGYILGNIAAAMAAFSTIYSYTITHLMQANVSNVDVTVLLKLAYPIITLLMLNIVYQKAFLKHKV